MPLPLYLLWFVWVDTMCDQSAGEGAFYVMLYMDADMYQLGLVGAYAVVSVGLVLYAHMHTQLHC